MISRSLQARQESKYKQAVKSHKKNGGTVAIGMVIGTYQGDPEVWRQYQQALTNYHNGMLR